MNASGKSLWLNPRRWAVFGVVMGLFCLFFSHFPGSESVALQGKPMGHWTSVLPPLLAVVVALCFHSLVWALLSAFVLGALLAFWPHVAMALPWGFRDFIWINFQEQFNLYIFAFLFALVGMVHVIHRSGGLHGLIGALSKVARGPRSTKFATMLSGLAIFFDDYSNTVVVGSTMRNLCDRWKVSREKLSYLVDATSAPVAGVAPLSTWIAFEVFLLGEAALALGMKESGYEIFLNMLPFRFYCWGTILFCLLTSVTGRDFGPMLRAERRAATEGKVLRDGAKLLTRESGAGSEPIPGKPQRWFNAVIPLAIVILGTLGGIVLLGRHKILAGGAAFSFQSAADWRNAFGMVTNPAITPGGAMKVLFLASVCSGIMAVVLATSQRILTVRQSMSAYARAVPTMWMALFILVMAWGMSKICTRGLHTDTYLVSLLGERLPLPYLPLAIFLLGAGISFATGTSFGTMAILIPTMFPLAHAMGAYRPENQTIFWLASAAILDGAIFGDHCSPISDTTVLSSISSQCDLVDHVNTQLPYATFTMLLASSAYVAVAFGMPAWGFCVAAPLASFAALVLVGRRVPAPAAAA